MGHWADDDDDWPTDLADIADRDWLVANAPDDLGCDADPGWRWEHTLICAAEHRHDRFGAHHAERLDNAVVAALWSFEGPLIGVEGEGMGIEIDLTEEATRAVDHALDRESRAILAERRRAWRSVIDSERSVRVSRRRSTPRARGAGRPRSTRRRTVRSSARSGDSDDGSEGEPAARHRARVGSRPSPTFTPGAGVALWCGVRDRLARTIVLAVIFVLAPSPIWLLAMLGTCVTLAQAGWLPPFFLRGPWAPAARQCPCSHRGDREPSTEPPALGD
jgi:hypothetical protein